MNFEIYIPMKMIKKTFFSVAEASRHFEIPKYTIHYALKNNKNLIISKKDQNFLKFKKI